MRTPPLILIVDDNPTNIDILQARLAANNYEIISAADGEEGLAMARDAQPDLILLDIMMPKMDGIEVCRHLRADASLPFMPIIMVTAKADSKDVVAGLEAGGDEYLTKPVDHAALVARVKSMLRIKSLHDTVLEQSAQLKAQLETATQIQSLFWPKIPELKAGGHIWAESVPSGKGVPAALIMAALSTNIRSEAMRQSEVDKLLETVNNTLHNLTSEEGFFATIVLARYWPASGKMQLALGGHLQPLWIVENGVGDLPPLKGISIGVTPDVHYEKQEINLSPGESILFFSDGIIEAENEDNELFGNDRLVDAIKNAKGPPWGKELIASIGQWRGNAKANDDVTLLEIWRDQA
jgi:CheY-like chemotaxis protein